MCVLSEIVRNCSNLRPQNRATCSNYKQDTKAFGFYCFSIMKPIRIVKRKLSEKVEHTENQKPDEPSTSKIVHTVKNWIAESQERKRSQRRSLPALGVLILIAFAVAMAQSPAPTNDSTIKVTIATTDGFLGQPAKRYKVGEQIPVTITMTNTSKEPLYTCISSDVYQDLPKLTRDGKLVPYMNWQTFETRYAERNHMCQEENLPEPALLKPNEPTVADWFLLVNDRAEDGAYAWYDTLPAGKYELTIQRRLACCDGPMVDSNKINFEVVP